MNLNIKMMRESLVLIAFILLSTISFSQSPLGIWKNIDDEDGEEKSHIEIYEVDGLLFGKVVKLLPKATITHCNKCKGSRKGLSLINMIILNGLEKNGDKWSGGKILDPGKGKEYHCQISLKDANTLKVRGYIGKPIFGRTQYWYRVNSHNNLESN